MSRASLIEAYISGLNLTEVAVVGAGRRCRISNRPLGVDLTPGEPIAHRYYFKPLHAELVLSTIDQDSMSGQPAGVLADAIEKAAAMLGAPIRTLTELRRAAELAVDEITARVMVANQEGELRQVNRRYKAYRQKQLAIGEKAVPYSAYLAAFTAGLVKQAAMTGGR
jgi:hypothetical protein